MCHNHYTHGRTSNEEQFHKQIKELMEKVFVGYSTDDLDNRINLVAEAMNKKQWAILKANPEGICDSGFFDRGESVKLKDLGGEESSDSSDFGEEDYSISKTFSTGEFLDSEGSDRYAFQDAKNSMDEFQYGLDEDRIDEFQFGRYEDSTAEYELEIEEDSMAEYELEPEEDSTDELELEAEQDCTDELVLEPDEDTEINSEDERIENQVFEGELAEYLEEPEEWQKVALRALKKDSGNEQDEIASYGLILKERMGSELEVDDDLPKAQHDIESEEERPIGVWEPEEVLKEFD